MKSVKSGKVQAVTNYNNIKQGNNDGAKFNYNALIYIACIVLIAFLLVINLGKSAKLMGVEYEISKLKETRDTLAKEIDRLTLQELALSSLDRIEDLAQKRLGMIRAEDKAVLDLSSSKIAIRNNEIAMKK
jgi:cell division protein FtsL